MRPTASIALGMLLGLLVSPGAARATVLAELPIEEMAIDADLIVMGRVVDEGVRIHMNDGRTEPWTISELRVERWIKGGGGTDTVRIQELGGEWQGGGMRIDGTPRYRVGERVLVFLWRDPQGRLRTYNMLQGRFEIRASVDGPTLAQRDLSGVGVAQWSSKGMQVRHGQAEPPMRLEELLTRIRQALEAVR